jgi:hypothetical protein
VTRAHNLLNFGSPKGPKGQGRKALFYTTTYVLYTLPEGMVVGLVAYGQVVGERREVIIDQRRTGCQGHSTLSSQVQRESYRRPTSPTSHSSGRLFLIHEGRVDL